MFLGGEKDGASTSLLSFSESGAPGVPTQYSSPAQYSSPSEPPANRGNLEVEVISGVRCSINYFVDGVSERTKLVKCPVFSWSTVGSLASTIQEQWDVNINARRIAGGDVRFVDYIVSESGAVVLSEYPAALLFSDKNSNTASIEIKYIFERRERPCCPKVSNDMKWLGVLLGIPVSFLGGASLHTVQYSCTLLPSLPLTPFIPSQIYFSALDRYYSFRFSNLVLFDSSYPLFLFHSIPFHKRLLYT